ncbi:GDP-fucose protein O-fucosyltransferase 2 [Harmonia axyridis]|uniref:GDP-fucose protein O-fucosyltransferase 2 n=1 Tax=Harmonia axyridis TaxID=115357 RepID=UPI001E276B49|nr:GDP-fucose protein O-fucosyltransferase 2 [Harmonia axyridis]
MNLFMSLLIYVLLIIIQNTTSYRDYDIDQEVCFKEDSGQNQCSQIEKENRYIFYDVNPSEGFNLRRDVYRRFAVLAKHLAESNNPKLKNFKLVLPPWSHLYHWTYSDKAELIPWGYYFDIPSLKAFAPVIEMYEFFEEEHKPGQTMTVIDEVYVMKNWNEMMKSGNFMNKLEVAACDQEEQISYFYYTNITSNNVKCMRFHGPSTLLTQILSASSARTILFAHAEVALHPTFGDSLYWTARRSLRYNKEMKIVANAFRERHLSSSNEADNIHLQDKWQDDKPRRNATGGPYLGVHMRRRDFFIGRPKQFPTLECVAKQIADTLQKLGLSVVFLATDAPSSDVEALQYYLPNNVILVKFIPQVRFVEHYKDGGTAIIDQLLCAHARYFIGTGDSTFTFRIFEEREILGFPTEATYNILCANENNCQRPAVWKIVY